MWRIGFSHFIRRLPSTDGLWASPRPRIVRPPVAACVVSACEAAVCGWRVHVGTTAVPSSIDDVRGPASARTLSASTSPVWASQYVANPLLLEGLDVGEHLVDVGPQELVRSVDSDAHETPFRSPGAPPAAPRGSLSYTSRRIGPSPGDRAADSRATTPGDNDSGMYVLALEVQIRIVNARSLKDKRQIVKSVLEGARRRFAVSASEVGHRTPANAACSGSPSSRRAPRTPRRSSTPSTATSGRASTSRSSPPNAPGSNSCERGCGVGAAVSAAARSSDWDGRS